MKKRILSMLLCVVLIVVGILSGCTKKPQNNKVDNDVNQDATQDDTQEEQNEEQKDETEEEKKATFHIVTEGKSNFVIVRGANATETEVYAAEELQEYIQKISGAKLAIVTDKKAVAEKEIIVGKTNREESGAFDRKALTEDGFVIKTTGSKLWLVGGGNRGTLYSVYTFLEDYLGCRYYTETIEKVPETKNVSIVEIEEDKQVPVLAYRDTDWKDYYGEDISVKQKLNSILWGRTLSGKVGGGISMAKGAGGHTHFSFVPPSEYFSSHPEYFSMNEQGQRINNNQLCLTNKDVLKITIEGVKQWLREDTAATFIALSPQDGGKPCYCDACKKVYAEEGDAYAGTNIRFTNAVAEAIKAEFPDVYVVTYAYEFYRKAPKTAPVDNVYIELATMGTCFSHAKENNKTCNATGSVLEDTDASNYYSTYYCEDVEAWGKLTKNLMIYDYSCNYYYWCMTWPDFDLLQKNINWYARNNLKGMKMQGNQHSKSIEFGELRAYLIAKLLWNPFMSEEEYYGHMDDFLTGVYGPGGKYIRKYIELAQEITDDKHYGLSPTPYEMYPLEEVERNGFDKLPKDLTVDMVKNYEKTDWSKFWNFYTDVEESPLSAQGKVLFGKALTMAETNTQKEQIQKIYLQVDYLKSYYYAKKINVADGDLTGLIKKFIAEHKDEFTEAETKKLPNAVYTFAADQMYNKYAAYNRTLCELLVKAGVTYRWEGGNLDGWQNYDFTAIPPTWTGQ